MSRPWVPAMEKTNSIRFWLLVWFCIYFFHEKVNCASEQYFGSIFFTGYESYQLDLDGQGRCFDLNVYEDTISGEDLNDRILVSSVRSVSNEAVLIRDFKLKYFLYLKSDDNSENTQLQICFLAEKLYDDAPDSATVEINWIRYQKILFRGAQSGFSTLSSISAVRDKTTCWKLFFPEQFPSPPTFIFTPLKKTIKYEGTLWAQTISSSYVNLCVDDLGVSDTEASLEIPSVYWLAMHKDLPVEDGPLKTALETNRLQYNSNPLTALETNDATVGCQTVLFDEPFPYVPFFFFSAGLYSTERLPVRQSTLDVWTAFVTETGFQVCIQSDNLVWNNGVSYIQPFFNWVAFVDDGLDFPQDTLLEGATIFTVQLLSPAPNLKSDTKDFLHNCARWFTDITGIDIGRVVIQEVKDEEIQQTVDSITRRIRIKYFIRPPRRLADVDLVVSTSKAANEFLRVIQIYNDLLSRMRRILETDYPNIRTFSKEFYKQYLVNFDDDGIIIGPTISNDTLLYRKCPTTPYKPRSMQPCPCSMNSQITVERHFLDKTYINECQDVTLLQDRKCGYGPCNFSSKADIYYPGSEKSPETQEKVEDYRNLYLRDVIQVQSISSVMRNQLPLLLAEPTSFLMHGGRIYGNLPIEELETKYSHRLYGFNTTYTSSNGNNFQSNVNELKLQDDNLSVGPSVDRNYLSTLLKRETKVAMNVTIQQPLQYYIAPIQNIH